MRIISYAMLSNVSLVVGANNKSYHVVNYDRGNTVIMYFLNFFYKKVFYDNRRRICVPCKK